MKIAPKLKGGLITVLVLAVIMFLLSVIFMGLANSWKLFGEFIRITPFVLALGLVLFMRKKMGVKIGPDVPSFKASKPSLPNGLGRWAMAILIVTIGYIVAFHKDATDETVEWIKTGRNWVLPVAVAVAIYYFLFKGKRGHRGGGGHEGGRFGLPHSATGLVGLILLILVTVVFAFLSWERLTTPPSPMSVEREVAVEVERTPRYYRTGMWEETLSPGQFSNWIEYPSGYRTRWWIKDPSVSVVLMRMGRRVGNQFIADNEPPRRLDERLVIAPGKDTVVQVGGVDALTLVIKRE